MLIGLLTQRDKGQENIFEPAQNHLGGGPLRGAERIACIHPPRLFLPLVQPFADAVFEQRQDTQAD